MAVHSHLLLDRVPQPPARVHSVVLVICDLRTQRAPNYWKDDPARLVGNAPLRKRERQVPCRPRRLRKELRSAMRRCQGSEWNPLLGGWANDTDQAWPAF